MCGISGYYSKKKRINLPDYYKNHKKIAHRGPDDEGFIINVNEKLEHAFGDDTIETKKIGYL